MQGIRRAVATAVLSFAGAVLAHAQTVVGTAVFPDSTTPIQGAIVEANDARGVLAVRALTGRRGEFTMQFAAAGTYSLRLLRIGYRPTIGPTVSLATGTVATVRIVFTGEAITLATVNVRERETCRVNADTGLAVARVWEEARKAMLTSQLSAGGPPLVAEWIRYERTTDSAARVVRLQSVRTSRNPTTHAFKSLPASELDAKGYIVPERDGTTYYAPDADALLSDLFVADHCFHLETPPAGTPGSERLIGVSFQPTRSRRDDRDIEGTIFVDRASAELRWLEFRYTNMPDVAEAAHAGGRVEFLRLSDGNWLINRWFLRMPQLGPRDRSSEAGQRRTIMAQSNVVLRALQFSGGEVTRVDRGDSLLYQAKGPTVLVQVVSRDSHVPAAGSVLTLDGTDYRGTADSLGRVRVSPVLAGRYVAHVHAPIMDTLGTPPVTLEVEARDNFKTEVPVDSVRLPSSRDVIGGACRHEPIETGHALLHGRVRDLSARPIERAMVLVTWQGDFSAVGDRLTYHEGTLSALSDASGYWRVCGVPTNTPLSITAKSDSGSDVRRATLGEGESLGTIDLVVHQISAAAREVAVAVAPVGRERAVVEISVFDSHGIPLPNSTLEVSTPADGSRTLVTGPSGLALMPEIAPGRIIVRARRLGFREGQVAAVVAAGRNTIPIVLSEVAVPTLDTIRVLGDRRVSGLRRNDEFETRRLRGEATQSITRDEIVKRNPVNLWQMLNGIPSIKVVDNDTMVMIVSTRTQIQSILENKPCPIAIMVDGQIVPPTPGYEGVDLRFLPAPDEVYGIEVFGGASTIPVQYGGVGKNKWCGMVAIWTR